MVVYIIFTSLQLDTPVHVIFTMLVTKICTGWHLLFLQIGVIDVVVYIIFASLQPNMPVHVIFTTLVTKICTVWHLLFLQTDMIDVKFYVLLCQPLKCKIKCRRLYKFVKKKYRIPTKQFQCNVMSEKWIIESNYIMKKKRKKKKRKQLYNLLVNVKGGVLNFLTIKAKPSKKIKAKRWWGPPVDGIHVSWWSHSRFAFALLD